MISRGQGGELLEVFRQGIKAEVSIATVRICPDPSEHKVFAMS